MFQVRNLTPFSADIALLPNFSGVDSIFPLLKATFDVQDGCRISDTQEPLRKGDVYRADPQESGLVWVGDYHPGKTGTDILVFGDCLPIDANPVTSCIIDVLVGKFEKRLQVYGNRHWDNGRISSPEYFDRLPVIYENAFGGQGPEGALPQNPIGKGFRAGRSVGEMNDILLPNVENPAELITTVDCKPTPWGVEAIPPFWPTRQCFAGSYDDEWRRTRAPLLPADFDPSFLNSASPGLVSHEPLKGGEPVAISNMNAGIQEWRLQLPELVIDCRLKWRQKIYEVPMVMDTVILLPNDSRVICTWRGSFPVNQWATRMEYVEFALEQIH